MPTAWNTRTYKQNRRRILATRPPCALCGLPGANSIDHIIPQSQGGPDTLGNLQPAHLQCNKAKGDGGKPNQYKAKW